MVHLRGAPSGAELDGTITGQVPVWDQATKEWGVSASSIVPGSDGVSVLDYLVDGRTLVEAINAAFADDSIEATQVYFPPFEYDIDDALESEVDGKVVKFVPGAVLLFSEGASLTLSGEDSHIVGSPVIRWDDEGTESFLVLVTLLGRLCSCERITFEINGGDLENTTLLRLSGDLSSVGDVLLTGVGGYNIGVELVADNGSEVPWCETGRVVWDPIDDGVTTRQFGSVVRMRCSDSLCGGVVCNTGGRTFVDAVIDDDGHRNAIDNPQINALKATRAILVRDGAEFLEVFGGILHQSSDGVGALALSNALELGEGSADFYGTKFIGYDIGVRFTGACDACCFTRCAFANNKTANFQIDTGGVVPVNGCTLIGCYFECEAVDTCINMHFKTGQALGMAIMGGQQAWGGAGGGAQDTSIKVEAAFGAADVTLGGVRFQASKVTDAVTQPGASTNFLFLRNNFFASNLISKGANAANATAIDTLSNTSLATKSLTISTLTFPGDAILGQWVDFFTANFGSGISANSFVELDFSFPEANALNKFVIAWTLTGNVAANGGLVFTCYLHDASFIRLRATNVTGSNIAAIAGTLFATVQRVLA